MRTRALVLAAAIGSLALASSALAAIVDGTPGDDRLRGTPNADVIRAFDGNDRVAGEQPVRDALALAQAVDRLTCTPARPDHSVGVVEHDHGLAALLEERSPASRVAVHPHVVLTDG